MSDKPEGTLNQKEPKCEHDFNTHWHFYDMDELTFSGTRKDKYPLCPFCPKKEETRMSEENEEKSKDFGSGDKLQPSEEDRKTIIEILDGFKLEVYRDGYEPMVDELAQALSDLRERWEKEKEELEKQCRGWIELQTKQIEDNNRLKASLSDMQNRFDREREKRNKAEEDNLLLKAENERLESLKKGVGK